MIVVDTSAWVEFFRGTDTPADRAVRRALHREDIALSEVVVMELLIGIRSRVGLTELRARIAPFPVVPLGGLAAYEMAAEFYRACREAGETVRNATDCLVAVAAIEAGAPVLHCDADFDKLARHTPLEVVPLDD